MIPIQNIYHMLAYAFQVLQENGYKKIATEEFDNAAELCTAILAKGVSNQIKKGLGKTYTPHTESTTTLRGKINTTESIKTQSLLNKKMICTYDEFSIDSYMNQIIKATMELLLKSDISKSRKKDLRKLLIYFKDVTPIDVYSINWNIRYNRNNQTYRMLISVCYLVVNGLLQSTMNGTVKLMDFIDEQKMSRLYEKFILEYYRQKFPKLNVSAAQIPWQLDDGFNSMLPVMQTDIMLCYDNKVLILDAKYYSHATQTNYNAHTQHSHNLYQIFTYVKNKEVELSNTPHTVAGMLLYAKTDDPFQPDNEYSMSGNKIIVKSLDLNCNFENIALQLNTIASNFFGEEIIN